MYVVNSFDDLRGIVDSIPHNGVVAVIDRLVERLYGEFFPYEKIVIEAIEENKSFETVEFILSRMLEREYSRDVLVLGVGGGVITDIVGFAASIYKRGVKFAFVPTTLLAQVDASIGGKCGVNLLNQKNMVGLFSSPEFIYANVSVLATLEKGEFVSGIAEMLKTFIIGSRENYEKAVDFFKTKGCKSPSMDRDISALADFIREAARIKLSIVARDQKDQGERKKLNLGHTFGHVIELELGLRHGEAVALGIILSAKFSHLLGYADDRLMKRLISDFESIGLPGDLSLIRRVFSGTAECRSLSALRNDKKVGDDMISLVLIKEIGSVFIEEISLLSVERSIDEII